MNQDELQRRLLEAFAQESADILERVGQCLVALEHARLGDQAEHVNQLFRELHTLKGSASAVGFDVVKRLAMAEPYVGVTLIDHTNFGCRTPHVKRHNL